MIFAVCDQRHGCCEGQSYAGDHRIKRGEGLCLRSLSGGVSHCGMGPFSKDVTQMCFFDFFSA